MSNSLRDIKKVTEAFKPTINRTCQVAEEFRVAAPAKPVQVDEMALSKFKDHKGRELEGSDVEQILHGAHQHMKAALGDDKTAPSAAHLHSVPKHPKWFNKAGGEGAHTSMEHFIRHASTWHDSNVKQWQKGALKPAEAYGASLDRSGKIIDHLKGNLAKFNELKGKHAKPAEAPAAGAPAAKPVVKPTSDYSL